MAGGCSVSHVASNWMTFNTHPNLEIELREAEMLIKASEWTSKPKISSILIKRITKLLKPFLKKGHPRAMWLKAQLPNLGESKLLTEKQFDQRWFALIQESAENGCAEAQYQYGCHLYDLNQIKEALELYHLSAVQDYAPSQWCYGLDTLSGAGTEKNEAIALQYISLAAEQCYPYALDFMLRAHQEQRYGLTNDISTIARYQRQLTRLDYL